MECENLFCIYFSNGICRLPLISLDIQGRCQECIYISADEDYLHQKREELLNRYQKEDSEF